MSDDPARRKRKPRPYTQERLQASAFHYLERFASNRARLRNVLVQRVRRSRDGASPTAEEERWIDAVVAKCERLGLVDDRAFAAMKAESMHRRGKPARAIGQWLAARGLEPEDREQGMAEALGDRPEDQDWQAAITFARKRRLGPYRSPTRPVADEQKEEQRMLGAFARAGFSFDIARRILAAGSIDELEEDEPSAPLG